MVISGCSYALIGRDFSHQMGAQIGFDPEGLKVLDKNGFFHVLTLAVKGEY